MKIEKIPQAINNYYTILLNRYIPWASQLYVLESDYKLGFIERYFAKYKLHNNYIFEINKQCYENFLNDQDYYYYELYDVIKIPWKLTGPYHDVKKFDGRILYGVFDTNKRTVSKANYKMPGISKKLWNLTEFAIINNGSKQDDTLQIKKTSSLE